MSIGERPLFVTNFGAEHGGASGRYHYLREVAQTDAFMPAAVAQSPG